MLADGLGFAAVLGAGATAALVAARRRPARAPRGRARPLRLAHRARPRRARWRVGVILASDVFHSAGSVETLLFGSLLLVDGGDSRFAAASAAIVAGRRARARAALARGGLRPGLGARARRCARRLPDTALLALVALAAVAALSTLGALLATALLVVPAATTRLLSAPAASAGSSATVALVAVEGVAGLWLSVQVNAPPGPAIAVLAGGVFAPSRRPGAAPRAGRLVAAAPSARSRCWPAAAARGARRRRPARSRSSRRRPRSATSRAQVGGDRAQVVADAAGPTPIPHDYEPRPSRRARRPPTPTVVLDNGDEPRPLDGRRRRGRPAATRRSSTSAPACRCSSPGSSGAEASRYDPHWWHDPRNAEAAVARDPRRAGAGRPRRPRRLRAQRRRLPAPGCARSTAASPAACAACRRARASSSPTTTPSATSPARYGITVVGAVIPSQTHAGPAVGGRRRAADAAHPARARQGGLPRELGQPQARPGDRAPDRRVERPRALRRHARARGARAARPTWPWSAPTPTRWSAASPAGARGCPIAGMRDPRRGPRRLAAGYGARAGAHATSSFALHAGERIGVLGPNGGGKTTLFRALLGELAPLAGTLDAPARFAVVPQTERSRLDFPVSALDVALMGTISTLPWWRRPGARSAARARAALERVGLADRAGATFGDLSGGQRQRVLVARALVQDARVLLLDEPFTGLDAPSAERLEALLAELGRRGPRAADRHPRRRPGARLGPRAVPQPPPGRVRRRPRTTLDRDGARGAPTAARSSSCPGGERAACCRPTITTLMLAALHIAHRSVGRPGRAARARSRSRCSGVARRRARLLDRLLRALLQRRVAGPRAAARARPRRADRPAAAARRRGGPARRRARVAAAGARPAIGRDTAVAVVVTDAVRRRRAARAVARLAAGAPGAAVRRRARRLATPTSRSPPALAVRRARRAARCCTARLLAVGFDRLSAPALGVRPLASTSRCSCSSRSRCSSPCRASATCSSSRCSSRPASAARLRHAADGPDDGACRSAIAVARRRRRAYLSYYAGTAAGASIAAVLVAAYLVAVAITRK